MYGESIPMMLSKMNDALDRAIAKLEALPDSYIYRSDVVEALKAMKEEK